MYPWIFGFGILFAFYNAWGIGANDCANSFATSVGAKVLTLKQAVIIAGIFEFGGAVLMGSHVTDTVRKSIVDIEIFEKNPGALMFGMLCADLSSAIWLTLATYFKYPVSTTHSIIGAIVGFSLAYGGVDAVDWVKIGFIILSWIVSPVLAGIFAFTIFYLIQTFIFESRKPFDNTLLLFPILTFITLFINVLFIIYKGTPNLDLDEMELWKCILISLSIGILSALLAQFAYLPYVKKKINKNNQIENDNANSNQIENDNNSNQNDNNANENDIIPVIDNKNYIYDNDKPIDFNINESKKYTQKLEKEKLNTSVSELHSNANNIDKESDELCSWIQIITACFSSFAHGSNDVANAIAPLATIFAIYKNGYISSKSNIPIWILVLGGFGIVVGLSTWGYKIIDRIGSELTKITPSRGFVIELSAATTVIIASRAEIPVSTTHCQVGSVLGCGLTSGLKNIKWSLVKGILFSWLVTLPFTGLLSAALFSFGYYSPYSDYMIQNSGSGSLEL